jgi:hypothetical protein
MLLAWHIEMALLQLISGDELSGITAVMVVAGDGSQG